MFRVTTMFRRIINCVSRKPNTLLCFSTYRRDMSTDCKCTKHKVVSSSAPRVYDLNEFNDVVPRRELTSEDDAVIARFKKFLQIPTITSDGPKGANDEMMRFLSEQFSSLNVSFKVETFVPGYPIFIATIPGQDVNLPSILLNCHYDVVPVMREHWNYDPFGAEELENGDIVARGTQDMKSVCMQYIESIRVLLSEGWTPRRTVHVAFQPDEETGGLNGMSKWVESEEIRSLNIGFALDEGLASESDKTVCFYGERAAWWLRIECTGPTGHGSRFIEDTAVEQLLQTLGKFQVFREQEKAKLGEGGCAHANALRLGDVTTLNITALEAGVKGPKDFVYNVIPQRAFAGIDIRIPPTVDLVQFEKDIQAKLTANMTYSFAVKTEKNVMTSIDEAENKYWRVFKAACESVGVSLDPQIFPAATDGRYLRNVSNLPVIGFSPIRNQPVLLHEHNERINKFTYLQGIQVYNTVIKQLSDMQ